MIAEFNKVKIFVTVPVEDLQKVRDAMCNAGAGIIGEYSYCTSSVKSIGTFLPSENANPYIGKQNQLEFVEEEKLEVICDVDKVAAVLKSLRAAHLYQEPAIDIYPLLDEKSFK